MENDGRRRKPKTLEGGFPLGQYIYMELSGGPPVVEGRNDISLEGIIITDFDKDTVTIRIPRRCLTTLSENPILPEGEESRDIETPGERYL